MEMNKENNTPFKAEDVNWDELAAIGILKDELEMAGELDTLLSGEKTNVVSLSPGAARRGRGDGRHTPVGTQGRRPAARNPRYQARGTVTPPSYNM